MKANEAPEKVYLHLTTGNSILNGKYYERKPAKIRNNDKIIEYTRTDALIEKAQLFLIDKLKEIPIGNDKFKLKAECSLQEFLEKLETYIKEN